jgi:hypothetical protein
MQERTRQLRSAKGQRCEANAFNTNVNINVLQRLASGHWSNNGEGNAVVCPDPLIAELVVGAGMFF